MSSYLEIGVTHVKLSFVNSVQDQMHLHGFRFTA